MKPRVVYWNNIPAPYMVERFNAVARRGNLDLEAWFSSKTESDREWTVDERSWEFRYRHLRGVDRGTSAVAVPTPLVRRPAPEAFVSLYAGPTYLLGSALARARGARTAFWVEVTFDSWVERRRWKEAAKAAVLPRADAALTAGRDGRAYAMRYGVSPERIFIVPHNVDAERYARASTIDRAERDRLRRELGVEGVVFLYVGRIWLGKGLSFLVDAFARLERERARDASLLLVGGGIDEDALRQRCKRHGLRNVVFSEFHQADSLPRIYAAADVFVFPTLGDPFGMVVPEAMACGLPVVTTSAAGEIEERVADGVNGFVVPPADSSSLHARMAALADDAELRRRMGEESRRRVAGQSPEHWAEAFEDAVAGILALPARGSRARR
jgi:glycosyltransferase involved in cell wall biosynthesis